MRWLWGLPLIPILICGVLCLGGVVVAFVAGRWSGKADAELGGDERMVPPMDVGTHE